MKNRALLLTTILAVAISISASTNKASGSSSPKEKQTIDNLKIRIMTYNIHHGNPPESDDVIDLDAIADIIRESGAQLIAVQELDSVADRSGKQFQLEYLAQKLDMHYYFFRTIPFQNGAYGLGILSSFPISELQTVALPKDTSLTSEDRVMGLAKVMLPNQQIVYFASTHWDYLSEKNRILQARKTIETIKKFEYPLILAGDLNTKTESESMKILREVFTEASTKFEPTIPNINPNRKIDHILHTNNEQFKLLNEEVINNSQSQKASDHLPFWVDLLLLDNDEH